MTEADHRPDSSLPQAGEPFSAPDVWETVDFPGALSVDTIPHSDAAPHPSELSAIQQLQHENAALRTQVAQLEQDLAQGQIEQQLIAAHAEHSNPSDAQLTQDLAMAQERSERLFQELELAHQASQRQQILVETLTKQLEGSQERIAQLERECTIAQQRYNEQVQQRLQAESACRDLRMRLHRQQQQTLQFKVALERSLEMSPPHRATVRSDDAAVEALPTTSPNRFVSFAAHNQPVRPWTSLRDTAPLSRLVAPGSSPTPANSPGKEAETNPEAAIAQPPVEPHSVAQAASSETPLEVLFPEPSEPLLYAADTAESNAIFDISPFIEAHPDATAIEPTAEPETPRPAEIAPIATTPIVVGNLDLPTEAIELDAAATPDPLWNNLSKLIDPTPVEAAPEPVVAPLPPEPALELPQPAQEPVFAQPVQSAPQLFEPNPTSVTVGVPVLAQSPSPIVYPLRAPKKRTSLAAVELPTFPKAK